MPSKTALINSASDEAVGDLFVHAQLLGHLAHRFVVALGFADGLIACRMRRTLWKLSPSRRQGMMSLTSSVVLVGKMMSA